MRLVLTSGEHRAVSGSTATIFNSFFLGLMKTPTHAGERTACPEPEAEVIVYLAVSVVPDFGPGGFAMNLRVRGILSNGCKTTPHSASRHDFFRKLSSPP